MRFSMGKNEEFEDELSRMKERRSRGRSRSQHRQDSTTGKSSANRADMSNSGSSRKKQEKPKKRSVKKIVMWVLLGILGVMAVLVVAAYGYVSSKFNKVQRVEDWKTEDIVNIELTPEQKEVMEGYKTIAVFGVDARDNNQLEKGTHSDVIMICNINMGTGEIQLVSVYRDTYLNIDDKNTYRKINAAYFNGGPKQAVKALNKNLDLNIEDYVTFNWKAVAMGINILGGVDIEINSKELRYLNAFITETVESTGIGSHQIKSPGLIHMDGVQAVAYGRLRLMDSDYARTERQKIVIKAAFEKAQKAGVAKLNELAGNMLEQVSTSLDWNDLIPLIENANKFYLGESLGFPMARGEMRYKGGDYVVPQTLESNVIELHKALFENEAYQPTATLKKISNHIAQISGFTKPGKNAGTVVIGGDSGSGNSKNESKATTAAVKETTEAETTLEESSEKGSDESEETKESEEYRSPAQATDEDGKPIASESTKENSQKGPGSETSKPASSENGSESSIPAGPSSPGISPGNPSKDPSESNGDLIYQEPTKETQEPGIYEEPGKSTENTSKSPIQPGKPDSSQKESSTAQTTAKETEKTTEKPTQGTEKPISPGVPSNGNEIIAPGESSSHNQPETTVSPISPGGVQ